MDYNISSLKITKIKNFKALQLEIYLSRVKKYHNPLVAEGESTSPMTKNIKNIF